MSRIPRLSPHPSKDLPITDDEKCSVLPLRRKIASIRLGEDVAHKHQGNKVQDKGTMTRTQEIKPVKKQSQKVTIPNPSLPSTSKGLASSGIKVNRQLQSLNRSKTESCIKLGNGSNQRNGKTSTPLAKRTASFHPEVRVSKAPITGAPSLKPRMSFRDKTPSKSQDRPIPSKIKAKSGEEKTGSAQFRTKKTEAPKVATGKPKSNHNPRMNRSKTESCINTVNVNKDRRSAKRIPSVRTDQQIPKCGKLKKEVGAELNFEPSQKQENALSVEDAKIELDVEALFRSPKDCPHGGLRFIPKRRKRLMSLEINIGQNDSTETPKEA